MPNQQNYVNNGVCKIRYWDLIQGRDHPSEHVEVLFRLVSFKKLSEGLKNLFVTHVTIQKPVIPLLVIRKG